jgi:methylase of polypeptide subunit release factors
MTPSHVPPCAGNRDESGAVWRHRQGVDEVTFYGLVLLRNEGLVMTPRATSERLVFEALCRLNGRGRCRIADVGTGSGAIAIAIASACPEVEVWATDANAVAVRLARANVRLHGLAARVFVERGDLLAPVPAPLDLIVANLPYVPEAAAADHPDLWTEPAEAVFAAGDGLGPYRRLVDDARDWLAADGALLLQLDRRILAAGRNDLAALRAGIDDVPPAVDAFIPKRPETTRTANSSALAAPGEMSPPKCTDGDPAPLARRERSGNLGRTANRRRSCCCNRFWYPQSQPRT